MRFYQAIDLPGRGHVPGAWDHRRSADVYLGHSAFKGKTALDIGPANGFWSFEMEKRGAEVTALELGEDDEWDAVPHADQDAGSLTGQLKLNVAGTHEQFCICRDALRSRVAVVRGSVYNAPRLVQPSDVVLLGNILQHLRDPFLAIERAASVAKQRIIISESIWHNDPALLNSAQLYLIPRQETPNVNHSWYQVSPVFVMEALKILGFGNLKNEIHEQKFCGTPGVDETARMVPHFTVSADRL